ncbi:glucosaminidase domain-containing protein [Neolewinella lacunae]|uniref:Glucosaminidase domain-containing protein n=1 Tax=Neolewinella lacunae TaxID=1517758 RepID=A0A923T780_9BACT|nr:glucosaminidase domain-containing protein [Neolewinella lacunae]MBC6994210.1 glucosaminidase domain-containing protein [Neolewinella lacunae]MDN3634631.1 glucosaminidase domain-containing protein [Neolewinella lacunae]
MKQIHLPIPSSLVLMLREFWRRIYEQFTSPWTKLVFLASLTLVFTRREFSFSLSINWDGLFTTSERTVFSDPSSTGQPEGALNAGAGEDVAARLANYVAPKKAWTAKQLKQLAYVDTYKNIALEQMATHGIPASITLAQGLLESGTGSSTLATKNKNHFGIKCFSKQCRKGHCSNHSDDHHKDFFRIFDSPEESFRAHSEVLRKDRYQPLFDLPITDYKAWSHGLSKAGYATDPRYGEKLIRTIEDLELWRYDEL